MKPFRIPMAIRYLINIVLFAAFLFIGKSLIDGGAISTYYAKVITLIGINIILAVSLNVATGCLPVAKTMAFCNLTTVISMFAGVIFLHEPFNMASLFASVLIILGIWGVQRA